MDTKYLVERLEKTEKQLNSLKSKIYFVAAVYLISKLIKCNIKIEKLENEKEQAKGE